MVPAEHPLVAHVLDVNGVHHLGTLHLDRLVTPVGLHARNLHFDQLLLDGRTNTGGVGKALALSIKVERYNKIAIFIITTCSER